MPAGCLSNHGKKFCLFQNFFRESSHPAQLRNLFRRLEHILFGAKDPQPELLCARGKRLVWRNALETYRVLRDRAEAHREDRAAGIVNHAWNILNVLAKKVELRLVLLNAYGRRDFSTLGVVAEKYVPEVIDALEGLNDSFRDQWFRGYKSYGLEIMQIRLAGLRERYTELARRIGELLDGRIDRIDELELRPETAGLGETRYRMIATGGWFV